LRGRHAYRARQKGSRVKPENDSGLYAQIFASLASIAFATARAMGSMISGVVDSSVSMGVWK